MTLITFRFPEGSVQRVIVEDAEAFGTGPWHPVTLALRARCHGSEIILPDGAYRAHAGPLLALFLEARGF